MKEVNELFIYAVMLDSLIAAYAQFMIMLTELKKVLPHELYQKNYGCESVTFLLH
jgi:hypothetical protein